MGELSELKELNKCIDAVTQLRCCGVIGVPESMAAARKIADMSEELLQRLKAESQ